MKVVLDTNILVSGFLSPSGPPGQIVHLVMSEGLVLCYDARILTEYRRVLSRPGFRFIHPHEVLILLDQVERRGCFTEPVSLLEPLPHRADEKFLEIAIGGGARYLVTGNLRHFPPGRRQGIQVVSPTEFLELWRQELG